jgi:hypothetical protein
MAQPPSFYGEQPHVGQLPPPINSAAPLAEGVDALARSAAAAQASSDQTQDQVRASNLQSQHIIRERQLQLQTGDAAAAIATASGALSIDLIALRQQPDIAGHEDRVDTRIGKFRDEVTDHLGDNPELAARFVDNIAAIAANARVGEAKWAAEQRATKSVEDSNVLQNSLQGNIRTAVATGTATDAMLKDFDALDASAVAALPIPGTEREKLLKERHQQRLVTAIDATIDVNPHAVVTEIDAGKFSELDDKVVNQLRERARVAGDRIDNKITQAANASSAVARAEARNAIEDVNAAVHVETATLQSYYAQVEHSDKPEDITLAHDLKIALAKNGTTARYDNSPPAERLAAVAEIEGHKGWQADAQLNAAHAQLLALNGRDAHAAAQDPVTLFQRQTGQQVPALKLGDPAVMARRFLAGDEAARRFATPLPMHFTEAEANDLRQQYNQATVDGKAGFIETLGHYGSGRAREMMAQIAPNKPELIRLAELSANPDPAVRSLVREASDGSAVPTREGTAGAVKGLMEREFGAALARMPGDRQAAIAQVATWITAHRLAAGGKADRFDPDVARSSIAAALGGTGAKGGLGTRNGAVVVLPMGTTQDDFDRMFTLGTPHDRRAASNGVPQWNGHDLTLRDFQGLVPVLINDTGTQALYAFRSRGGSGYVKTERNDDYVLDLRALAQLLRAHR